MNQANISLVVFLVKFGSFLIKISLFSYFYIYTKNYPKCNLYEMLPMQDVIYTKCYLYEKLPMQNVTYTKCYLDKVYYTKCYYTKMYYTKRYWSTSCKYNSALYSEVNMKSYCTHFLYCPAQLSWLGLYCTESTFALWYTKFTLLILIKMAWVGVVFILTKVRGFAVDLARGGKPFK